ncbi:MAG: hypothetical protein D4R67_07110 [Bacteroidetes bacterium]|nr:MAG: hypothetical protein D4R67_07110 [Bacteroidota bacterium]
MEQKFDYKYKDPEHGHYRELFYSYDKDGNYKKQVRFHDDSDKIFIEQFWDVQNNRIQEAKEQVLSGIKSPVYYYMKKNLMDLMTLSSQATISLWRVKRHLKPGIFKRLSEKTLAKYAGAFNITIEELQNIS